MLTGPIRALHLELLAFTRWLFRVKPPHMNLGAGQMFLGLVMLTVVGLAMGALIASL